MYKEIVKRKVTAKLICLTRNQYAIVDDDLYDYINQWNWQAVTNGSGSYYAQRQIRNGKKRTLIKMVECVLLQEEGKQYHHINHFTLDNRRVNLVLIDTIQNLQLKRSHKGRPFSSRFIGVSQAYFRKKTQKWVYRVHCYSRHVGSFTDEVEAAKVYDKEAIRVFGPSVQLNFPPKGTQETGSKV